MTGTPPPPPPPEGQQPPEHGRRLVGPPSSLLAAVKLMLVGAGLQALALVFSYAARVELRDQIAEEQPDLTADQVERAMNVQLMSVAVVDILAVAMWIWMAQTNQRGLEWARIVATVLGPLNIAFTVFSLSQSAGVAIVVRFLTIALSAAILFLLYRPDSTAYYKAVTTRARPLPPPAVE
ncbi:MAG TPA: hypothetical protein VK895_13075 [Jiangellaceae bacterium]|nr:hypothetical protein [Jiangellaceae bacterium]